ncbi:MAG: hypothetical protein N2578_09395 [Bdellovibrionaceae bacterium]|nr:hypothetical protein [Pseudobdellovibrionaceae bacterium]
MGGEIPKMEWADVIGTAQRLAEIIKQDRSAIDRGEYQRGDALLAFFEDPNFGTRGGLPELKVQVLHQCLEDLATHAKVLAEAYVGIVFLNNNFEIFISPYGESPEGTVVYKVGLKNYAAFQRWRRGEATEVGQEDINAGIYRLAVELARF